jgi:antitoxin HicB
MKKTANSHSIEYYLELPYEVTIVREADGGMVAKINDLPGCITQADSNDEILQLIEDAKRLWIEDALENGEIIPEPAVESYSGKFHLRMPKSLHQKLALQAKTEGISLNQYAVSLLSENNVLRTLQLDISKRGNANS